MTQAGEPLFPGVDMSVPSVARMYDYFLGGTDNYAADREASEALSKAAPGTREQAVDNRRFVARAVRRLAREHGVRQFLDHGSGLPTRDNVHQIAQRVDKRSRVVYVDNDPTVLAHGRALLEADDSTAVVGADLRDTDAILGHPDVTRLLDLDRPVAALFASVLHCVPDADDPAGVVRRVMDRLAPGSFAVISHLVGDDPGTRERLTAFMLERTRGNWGRVREPREVERFFDGLEVLEPGIVEVAAWHPEPGDSGPRRGTREWIEYGGVARRPARNRGAA